MPDSEKVLNEILSAGPSRDEKRVVAIFDLDSTLFDVSHRSQSIIHDFTKDAHFLKTYPADIERLKMIRIQAADWGIKEAIVRQGWAAPPEFFIAIRDYWRQHFFGNDYLKYDKPYEGSLEFVLAIHKAGIDIKYLTGRDRPDMHAGTVASLKQWGFPLDDIEGQLFMKPAKGSAEDEDFKVQQMQNFAKTYDMIYFFENEPVIINKMLVALPQVKIIFLDTVHSRKAIVPPHLTKITKFHKIKKS